MQEGRRVWHLSYGRGIVEALVAGRRARVRFDRAPDLPRTLARGELQVGGADEEPDPRDAAPVAPRVPPRPVLSIPVGESAAIRQTIEALRLGVVPSRYVEDYTVGRDRELRQLKALLDAGQGFRALCGGYGAGKTHFLDIAEHRARERGFATCRIVVDPLEMPPTHPKRLYGAVLNELRMPDTADIGLDALAHRLCESPDHRLPEGRSFSRFFSPYLHALHCHDPEAIALLRDYVAGEDVKTYLLDSILQRTGWRGPTPLTLSDFRTYGRLYVHLLGTLASWIRDAGHQGLVLLFDEVEHVNSLTRTELAYATAVLKHFAAVTLSRTALGFDPENPDELYRGGHAIHRAIPLRFRPDQPLSVVFALTPLDTTSRLYATIVTDAATSIALTPLQDAHLDELLIRVEALYRRGYPGTSWSDSDWIRARKRVMSHLDDDGSTIRKFVQRTVCMLDEHRYRGWRTHGA